MSGQGSALRRGQHVIDIREELRQSLGGLIGQLEMRDACSFQRSPVHGVLCQCRNGLRMSGLQLRVHRQQVVHGLFHQGCDLRLLCVGGVDLNVQMLQHMIDMRGDILGAMRAAQHGVMKAASAHPCRSYCDYVAGQGSSGDKGD